MISESMIIQIVLIYIYNSTDKLIKNTSGFIKFDSKTGIVTKKHLLTIIYNGDGDCLIIEQSNDTLYCCLNKDGCGTLEIKLSNELDNFISELDKIISEKIKDMRGLMYNVTSEDLCFTYPKKLTILMNKGTC